MLLLRNILPVNSIQILPFLVVASILLLTQLVLLNIELSLFLDPGLVGIWAYDDVYAIDKFGPRVRLVASKTFILAAAAGILVTSGDVIAVSPQSLLGYTWMGLAVGNMKLLAPALLYPNNITNVR
jgi:hypothetical protein